MSPLGWRRSMCATVYLQQGTGRESVYEVLKLYIFLLLLLV